MLLLGMAGCQTIEPSGSPSLLFNRLDALLDQEFSPAEPSSDSTRIFCCPHPAPWRASLLRPSQKRPPAGLPGPFKTGQGVHDDGTVDWSRVDVMEEGRDCHPPSGSEERLDEGRERLGEGRERLDEGRERLDRAVGGRELPLSGQWSPVIVNRVPSRAIIATKGTGKRPGDPSLSTSQG
jgi:hypothetical protein